MDLGHPHKNGGNLPNLGNNYSKTKAVPEGHGLELSHIILFQPVTFW